MACKHASCAFWLIHAPILDEVCVLGVSVAQREWLRMPQGTARPPQSAAADAEGVQSLRLSYTPRKFLVHPERKTLIIAEADHGSIPSVEREPLPPAFAGALSAPVASSIA